MIEILLKQQVDCPIGPLVAIMLEHDKLGRFFDAKFKQTKPALDNEPAGGCGAIRQVTMRGSSFLEEIIQANEHQISYRIIGSGPVSNHRADIYFTQQDQHTLINYSICCSAPWWQPDFLVKFVIERDIAKGLNKLASYCDER